MFFALPSPLYISGIITFTAKLRLKLDFCFISPSRILYKRPDKLYEEMGNRAKRIKEMLKDGSCIGVELERRTLIFLVLHNAYISSQWDIYWNDE